MSFVIECLPPKSKRAGAVRYNGAADGMRLTSG